MIETIVTGDLGVNTYLYNFKDKKALIIDPGAEPEKIIHRIEEKNLEIVGIILTHGHFDHIGALQELKEKFKVPLYIHKDDSTFLGPESMERHRQMFKPMGAQGMFYVDTYYMETPKADIVLEDNQELNDFGLKVIHTPGHSPGSICLFSQENGIVFTGDTLFKNGLGRTDFGGGDYNTLIKSLEKLFSLPMETVAYPGHGPITHIGDEK